MVDDYPPIPPADPERRAYLDGALAEAHLTVCDMTKDGRELYDFVQVVAQQGRTADDITRSVTVVFTADWPLHARLALAWQVIRRG